MIIESQRKDSLRTTESKTQWNSDKGMTYAQGYDITVLLLLNFKPNYKHCDSK